MKEFFIYYIVGKAEEARRESGGQAKFPSAEIRKKKSLSFCGVGCML